MFAEASVAYSRICDDPDADKFEYPEYMRKQERETRKAYASLIEGREPALNSFKNAKNIYVDTTQMTTDEVLKIVTEKLSSILDD